MEFDGLITFVLYLFINSFNLVLQMNFGRTMVMFVFCPQTASLKCLTSLMECLSMPVSMSRGSGCFLVSPVLVKGNIFFYIIIIVFDVLGDFNFKYDS